MCRVLDQPDDSGWEWIQTNQSGDTWNNQVGVDTGLDPGTLQYYVRTLDSLNNETTSSVSSHNFAYRGDQLVSLINRKFVICLKNV